MRRRRGSGYYTGYLAFFIRSLLSYGKQASGIPAAETSPTSTGPGEALKEVTGEALNFLDIPTFLTLLEIPKTIHFAVYGYKRNVYFLNVLSIVLTVPPTENL